MQIIFNLSDTDDVKATLRMVSVHAPGAVKSVFSVDPSDMARTVSSVARATPEPKPEPVTDTTADPKIGVETDSRGVPWIEEVHAGTKGQNKDGTWKKKRGVEDAVVEAAEKAALAELDATPEPTMPEEAPDPVDAAAPPVGTGLPGTAPAAAPTPVSFQDITDAYVARVNEGNFSPDQMVALYEKHSTNPKDLETNETARAAIYAELTAPVGAPTGLPG